jgi:hypothetical protein
MSELEEGGQVGDARAHDVAPVGNRIIVGQCLTCPFPRIYFDLQAVKLLLAGDA